MDSSMSTDLDWLALDQDEDLIWSGTPRIQTLYSVVGFVIAATVAPAIVIGWKAALTGFLVGSIILTVSYFTLINTEYVVSTKYAYSKKGIYGRNVTKIGLKNIQDTSFSQGLLGRQFDYGTLDFSTAGGTGHELSFRNINTPRETQSKINNQLHELRQKHAQNEAPTEAGRSSDEILEELTTEMKRIREAVDEINAHHTDTATQDTGNRE